MSITFKAFLFGKKYVIPPILQNIKQNGYVSAFTGCFGSENQVSNLTA